MTSLRTNSSAMVVLQAAKSVSLQMGHAHADIATGQSAASVRQDAAVRAVCRVTETDQPEFKTIPSALNVADAVVVSTRSEAEQITRRPNAVRDLASDGPGFGTIRTDIDGKRQRIAVVIDAPHLNDINLPATDANEAGASSPAAPRSLDRGKGRVITTMGDILAAGVDLGIAIKGASVLVSEVWGASGTASAGIGRLITTPAKGAAIPGLSGNRISDQSGAAGKLADMSKIGTGPSVAVAVKKANAGLQALPIQQQLIRSLSIASQAR